MKIRDSTSNAYFPKNFGRPIQNVSASFSQKNRKSRVVSITIHTMKSKFIKCPAILFAALLGSATSTLLRGDYALRSPRRILEKKHESSSAIDDAGRKNTNSYAKGSKKSSKKNGNLEHADVSIAVGEIGPKETQIVHSHHPKAAEKDDPNSETSDAKGASNKAIKQVVHSHHPKGAEVHPELHDSEGKKSKNGRRSFKKRSENDETTVVENQSVLSRVYDTQDFSLNDEGMYCGLTVFYKALYSLFDGTQTFPI